MYIYIYIEREREIDCLCYLSLLNAASPIRGSQAPGPGGCIIISPGLTHFGCVSRSDFRCSELLGMCILVFRCIFPDIR